jgi:hypothetical protein
VERLSFREWTGRENYQHLGEIMSRYLWNILIALDQLLNAFLCGDPDETVSSRAAKNLHLWHWSMLARFLEWIDPGHMKRAIELDEGDDAAWRYRNRDPP